MVALSSVSCADEKLVTLLVGIPSARPTVKHIFIIATIFKNKGYRALLTSRQHSGEDPALSELNGFPFFEELLNDFHTSRPRRRTLATLIISRPVAHQHAVVVGLVRLQTTTTVQTTGSKFHSLMHMHFHNWSHHCRQGSGDVNWVVTHFVADARQVEQEHRAIQHVIIELQEIGDMTLLVQNLHSSHCILSSPDQRTTVEPTAVWRYRQKRDQSLP